MGSEQGVTWSLWEIHGNPSIDVNIMKIFMRGITIFWDVIGVINGDVTNKNE